MKQIKLLLLTCLLISLSLISEASNNSKSEKTLFLSLTYDGQNFVIEKSQILDSPLKVNRHRKLDKEFRITLNDINSDELFVESLENPLVKEYEVEDPENPGHFIKKVITVPSVTFDLRLPFSNKVKTIELFKHEVNSSNSNQNQYLKLQTISVEQIKDKLNE